MLLDPFVSNVGPGPVKPAIHTNGNTSIMNGINQLKDCLAVMQPFGDIMYNHTNDVLDWGILGG